MLGLHSKQRGSQQNGQYEYCNVLNGEDALKGSEIHSISLVFLLLVFADGLAITTH